MGTIKEITFDKEAAELLEKILRSGEKIGIACSGGADSMLLLHSLLQRFPDKKDCFTVMHFNHKVNASQKYPNRLCARPASSSSGKRRKARGFAQ